MVTLLILFVINNEEEDLDAIASNDDKDIYELPTILQYREALELIGNLKSINKLENVETYKNTFNQVLTTISNSKTSYFDLHKAIQEQKWVQLIAKIFENHGYPNLLAERTYYDKKKKREVETIYLRSKGSIQLALLRKRFYPKGIKIVPMDLILTPDIVLHWFIGDGSASVNNIVFATDNFKKEEVEFLSNLLRETIGIHTYITKVKDEDYPDKLYYRVGIRRVNDIPKFYAYIEKANQETVIIAKKLFPWKFDPNLLKRDVIN